MRVLLIFTCLLTFALNSFATSADAAMPEESHLCGAVVLDHSEGDSHVHCNDDNDHKECSGCCCLHAHSVAMLPSANLVTPFLIDKNELRQESAQYNSYDTKSLYRPPRL